MSRGGRGAPAKSGVSILASALNIQRNEISSGPPVIQAPPLFPILDVQPLPSVSTNDLNYMVESKQEFLRRMRESPYYLREKAPKSDVERYSDKYKKRIVDPWTPQWKRMPKILWPRSMLDLPGKSSSKRFKSDGKQDANFKTKLETLEFQEKQKSDATGGGESPKKRQEEKEDDDENVDKNEDEQEMSDDDYQEEENDYIQSYFDNGEEYLDESDDNLDGEAVF